MEFNRNQYGKVRSFRAGGDFVPVESEPQLLYRRISATMPPLANGGDLAFCCYSDGGLFYCKDDKDGRPVRASEWLFTRLAANLGIRTSVCSVIEDAHQNTFFGSLYNTTTDLEARLNQYLLTPKVDETGRPTNWFTRYLSMLFVYDTFIGNPDRGMRNFSLEPDGINPRLAVFDFASARLDRLSVGNFPIETDATVCEGKILQAIHSFSLEASMEMTDRIGAIGVGTIASILGEMPENWLSIEQRDSVIEFWGGNELQFRLSALRDTLRNAGKL